MKINTLPIISKQTSKTSLPSSSSSVKHKGRVWNFFPSRSCATKLALVIGVVIAAAYLIRPTGATFADNRQLLGRCNQTPSHLDLSNQIDNGECSVPAFDDVPVHCPHGYQSISKNFFANFMRNGQVLLKDGNTGCALNNEMSWFDECPSLVHMGENYLKDSDKSTLEYAYSDRALAETGTPIHIDDLTIIVGLDPEKRARYLQALSLTEDFFLGKEPWYEKNQHFITNFIKQLHKTLTKGVFTLETESVVRPGQYRNDDLFVKHDSTLLPDQFQDYLKNNGATDAEMTIFEDSIRKLQEGIKMSDFSDKEKAVWKMIAYIPPSPKQIPSLMRTFLNHLKEKYLQSEHPIELAAWANSELGRIHPFSDGNGRIGRLFMNGILAHAGYRPLIIPNDSEYTVALHADDDQSGSFARYLVEKVIPWNTQNIPYLT